MHSEGGEKLYAHVNLKLLITADRMAKQSEKNIRLLKSAEEVLFLSVGKGDK